jgi:hypothetical protein
MIMSKVKNMNKKVAEGFILKNMDEFEKPLSIFRNNSHEWMK